jgi:hypothetical protein
MQQAARLLAICVFGLGVTQTGTAEACIKSNFPGEFRIVSRAITLKSTPQADKRELKRLLAVMRANRGFAPHEREAYREAVTKAFKIMGEDRVIITEPARPDQKASAAPKGAFVGCG